MEIFAFGSNLAGRHGAGAALAALKDHGAIYGCGEGIQGQSYAIPTKDRTPWPSKPKTLPLYVIAEYITEFLQFSQLHPELTFNMTRIGCGLAGYKDHEIAPMFRGASPNVIFPPEWLPYVERSKAA